VNGNSHDQRYSGDNPYGDEISLIDLWLVLVRRKWVILVIFVLCFAIGMIYTVAQPVRYQYVTGMDLATLPERPGATDFTLPLPKEDSIDLLENVIIPLQREVLFGNKTRGPQVQVRDEKRTYNLTLVSTARPKEAGDVEKLHEASVLALVKEQNQILEKALSLEVNPYKARSAVLREQIKAIEEQFESLTKQIDDENEIKALIYVQQVGDLRQELAQARLELADAESSAKAIVEGSQGATLSYLAVRSKSPVGPDNILLIILSLVLGGMLGVFGAFLAEFFQKARQAARQRI